MYIVMSDMKKLEKKYVVTKGSHVTHSKTCHVPMRYVTQVRAVSLAQHVAYQCNTKQHAFALA